MNFKFKKSRLTRMGKDGVCTRSLPMRLLVQGLDDAGKTTILHKLKLGELVTTSTTTLGYNVEAICQNGVEIFCWDIGGRQMMRPLFRHHCANSDGMVYVIDSADLDRMDISLHILNRLFSEEVLQDKVVMVLANKQDLSGAIGPGKIETKLKDKCEIGDFTVFVMPCSADTNQGLDVAFSRFAYYTKLKKEGKLPCGLIPWAWLGANQEAGNNGTNRDVSDGGDTEGVVHILKKSCFKDPFNLLKSLLFY